MNRNTLLLLPANVQAAKMDERTEMGNPSKNTFMFYVKKRNIIGPLLARNEEDAVDLFLDGSQYDCRMRIFVARRHIKATAILLPFVSFADPMGWQTGFFRRFYFLLCA